MQLIFPVKEPGGGGGGKSEDRLNLWFWGIFRFFGLGILFSFMVEVNWGRILDRMKLQ